MDINYAYSLSYTAIRKLYKTHLQGLELGHRTVGTTLGDTFYLWNNGGKELFWETVLSDDFETVARKALIDALKKKLYRERRQADKRLCLQFKEVPLIRNGERY